VKNYQYRRMLGYLARIGSAMMVTGKWEVNVNQYSRINFVNLWF